MRLTDSPKRLTQELRKPYAIEIADVTAWPILNPGVKIMYSEISSGRGPSAGLEANPLVAEDMQHLIFVGFRSALVMRGSAISVGRSSSMELELTQGRKGWVTASVGTGAGFIIGNDQIGRKR